MFTFTCSQGKNGDYKNHVPYFVNEIRIVVTIHNSLGLQGGRNEALADLLADERLAIPGNDGQEEAIFHLPS